MTLADKQRHCTVCCEELLEKIIKNEMVAKKPFFGLSDNVRLNPACSAIETTINVL